MCQVRSLINGLFILMSCCKKEVAGKIQSSWAYALAWKSLLILLWNLQLVLSFLWICPHEIRAASDYASPRFLCYRLTYETELPERTEFDNKRYCILSNSTGKEIRAEIHIEVTVNGSIIFFAIDTQVSHQKLRRNF